MPSTQPVISYFGNRLAATLTVATKKYRDCPWPHFDGALDLNPNRILVCDFAITLVMNSGVRMKHAWAAVERSEKKAVPALLAQIPVDLRIEDTSEDSDRVDWKSLDLLFEKIAGTRVRLSRVAKMLCRKRPHLIPMLDSVVVDFLKKRAREWHKGRNSPPYWYNGQLWESWSSWEVPSPYIRMIRHDILSQVTALRQLRDCLNADPATEVPSDASLLRIYEATLWKALEEGLL